MASPPHCSPPTSCCRLSSGSENSLDVVQSYLEKLGLEELVSGEDLATDHARPLSVVSGGSHEFQNVAISNSKDVHLGNVTYYMGPVVNLVRQESHTQQVFVSVHKGGDQEVHKSGKLRVIKRREWLAQPPMEDPETLKTPVSQVIISHTATEAGFTVAENVFLVRTIQTYHIESKDWNDIAYNFLVGMDGCVYEGRGYTAVGAHTYGYNTSSIGISFVGCFMKKLPTPEALGACQILIEEGVRLGFISSDYKLYGHCQLSPVESPGKTLFDAIKTWPHWSEKPESND